MTSSVTALCVALAGGIGAVARYLLDSAVQRRIGRIAPIGTMCVNAIGSFVLGLVTGVVVHHGVPVRAEVILGVGFCGGLTTFSTASFEAIRLARERFGRVALFTAVGGFSISCATGALGLLVALV